MKFGFQEPRRKKIQLTGLLQVSSKDTRISLSDDFKHRYPELESVDYIVDTNKNMYLVLFKDNSRFFLSEKGYFRNTKFAKLLENVHIATECSGTEEIAFTDGSLPANEVINNNDNIIAICKLELMRKESPENSILAPLTQESLESLPLTND